MTKTLTKHDLAHRIAEVFIEQLDEEVAMEIPLTQGKVAIVDADDYEELSKYKWQYSATNGYAVGQIRYDDGTYSEKVLMHRYIIGTRKGLHTDHINGDKLDNRKENLRECLPSENYVNRGICIKRNKSGYKGVYWRSEKEKYQVTLRKNNKTFYVGLFEDINEAILMYDFWAMQMWGEFAKPNLFSFEDVVSIG